MSGKTRKIVSILLVTALVATLAWIWGNSLQNNAVSQEKSTDIVEVVPSVKKTPEARNLADYYVRKLAHLLEFFILGVELLGLTLIRSGQGRVRLTSVVTALFFGLLTALTDETIQAFNDRNSSVADVWLDFAGIVLGAGILLGFVLCWMKGKRKNRRNQ